MSDGWEVYYGLNPLSYNDRWDDPDNDDLFNYEEYNLRNKGAKPNYPDLFVEVDYMSGHYPRSSVHDYIENYYAARGFHVVFEIDDEIPYDNVVDRSEWNSLHSTYFDNSDTHHHVICGAVYKNSKGQTGSLGVSAGVPSDQIFMADKSCDDSVVVSNLAAAAAAAAAAAVAFLIGGVIAAAAAFAATMALMAVTEWQMEAVVLMHEIGHSVGVIDRDSKGLEKYCSDAFCVMATGSFLNCDPSPHYCSHHWSQVDFD